MCASCVLGRSKSGMTMPSSVAACRVRPLPRGRPHCGATKNCCRSAGHRQSASTAAVLRWSKPTGWPPCSAWMSCMSRMIRSIIRRFRTKTGWSRSPCHKPWSLALRRCRAPQPAIWPTRSRPTRLGPDCVAGFLSRPTWNRARSWGRRSMAHGRLPSTATTTMSTGCAVRLPTSTAGRL